MKAARSVGIVVLGLGMQVVNATAAEVAGNGAAPISIKHFSYSPKELTVTAGSEVRWVNRDSFSHSVVIEGVESRRLMMGSKLGHVFEKPGTYRYHCGVHKSMQGVVNVVAASGDSASVTPVVEKSPASQSSDVAEPETIKAVGAVSISDPMRFEPATLKVEVGTEVTWTNNDGSNHILVFPDQRSKRLRHGASYTRRFDAPGDYAYECAIHGKKMTGRVVVVAP